MKEIMDECGLTDAALVQKCLMPLLQANRTRYFHHRGRVKDKRTEAALEIRRDTLDIALPIKGKYAPPAVEQEHKHTVQVIVLVVPRPKRDIPPPTTIEVMQNSETVSNGGKVSERKIPQILSK